MKYLLVVAVVLAPSGASAQGGVEEIQKGEFRIGLSVMPARRVSLGTGSAAVTTSTSLTGFDLFARTDGIGVYARSVTGTFTPAGDAASGAFVLREAGLLIGGPTLSVQGGVIRRTTSALNDPTDRTFWRGGARSFWQIGSSGLQVTLNAGVRFGKAPDGTGESVKFLGVDGEASAIFQAPRRLPFYLLAGWRYERLDDLWGPTPRYEELSGPMFGIGFRIAPAPFVR